MNLQIPLQIGKEGILHTRDIKESLDKSLEMLLNTPTGSAVCDPEYGFVLTKMRFEIFNEREGTVLNSANDDDILYKKKLSGSSKNMMTFASELKDVVIQYEPRLSSPSVVMTYMRESRQILVTIRGSIIETGEKYEYQTVITVWSKH